MRKPECVCDLVDAEVSHPEDNRAGHELSLGALSGSTEGRGRGAYLTWTGKEERRQRRK